MLESGVLFILNRDISAFAISRFRQKPQIFPVITKLASLDDAKTTELKLKPTSISDPRIHTLTFDRLASPV